MLLINFVLEIHFDKYSAKYNLLKMIKLKSLLKPKNFVIYLYKTNFL